MSRTDNAATSHLSPPLDLPPTAAEQDPAPPDPGRCPTCGQQRPNPINSFATGSSVNHPSLHLATREPDSPLEPDGEDAHRVRGLLRSGYSVEEIASSVDLTPAQVEGVARFEAARLQSPDASPVVRVDRVQREEF